MSYYNILTFKEVNSLGDQIIWEKQYDLHIILWIFNKVRSILGDLKNVIRIISIVDALIAWREFLEALYI